MGTCEQGDKSCPRSEVLGTRGGVISGVLLVQNRRRGGNGSETSGQGLRWCFEPRRGDNEGVGDFGDHKKGTFGAQSHQDRSCLWDNSALGLKIPFFPQRAALNLRITWVLGANADFLKSCRLPLPAAYFGAGV